MEQEIPDTNNNAIDLAVLDAPVLAREGVTLFLLHLASAGAFDPIWSDHIHAEWSRDAPRQHPTLPVEWSRQRRQALEAAFPAANVAGSRDMLDEIVSHCTTPAERKAAHVLATALSARAAVIISDSSFCLGGVISKLWHDVAVVEADAWCQDLLDRRTDLVLEGARAHRARIAPMETEAWLKRLAVHLPGTAASLAARGDAL